MKKQFVAATFLHHIDYGDIIYLRAPVSSLQMLHTVYHGAVRFITGCLCVSSLFTCRLLHWYSLIYISIIGLLLLPICHLNTVITASAHKQSSSNSTYRTWEKGIFLQCSLYLEQITTGFETVQLN